MVRCEVCGRAPAGRFCLRCNAIVCESCFDPSAEKCVVCTRLPQKGFQKVGAEILSWFMRLFLVGLAVAFVGSLLVLLSLPGEGSGVFIILIGPIPIGLGYGSHASTLAAVSLILVTACIIVTLYVRKRLR